MSMSLRYPLAAGQWLFTRDGVDCRLPRHTVKVKAPRRFLEVVMRLCDGQRDMDTVRNELLARWKPDDVSRCLGSLEGGGVLIEAGTVTRHELRRSWMPQRLPTLNGYANLRSERRAEAVTPAPRLTGPLVFKPKPSALTNLLMKRRPVSTFDDAGLTESAVDLILWALYGAGIQPDVSYARTVPSAGELCPTSWYVACLKEAGHYARGLYELRYGLDSEGDSAVQLLNLPGNPDRAWETLLSPALLEYAHLVIYPVANMTALEAEFGNRAAMHAMLEAGHSLQSGVLAAIEAGASAEVCGDTLEFAVLGVFGLDQSRLPLPALVVGAQASSGQEALAKKVASRVQVKTVPPRSVCDQRLSSMSIAGPVVRGPDTSSVSWTSGRATCGRLASRKAEAEAWERLGWLTPQRLVAGRWLDFDQAIQPRDIVDYAAFQYGVDFPFHPFDEAAVHEWVVGENVRSGRPSHLPAQCVFALNSLSDSERLRPYANASTSGVAAWTSRERALTQALTELIERDAFLHTWVARRAPPRFDERALPHELTRRLANIREAGFELDVLCIPCKYLVVAALHVQGVSEVFAAITTGAGFSASGAIESSLAEAETRIQGRSRFATRARIRASEVQGTADHGAYFQTRASVGKTWWIRQSEAKASANRSASVRSGEELLDALWRDGHEVYACDLTPPGASLGQGRTPLYVTRAIVPGFIPLWFGHNTTPWGTLSKLGLLAEAKFRKDIALHPCT